MTSVFGRKFLRMAATLAMLAVTGVFVFAAPNFFASDAPTTTESLNFLGRVLVLLAAWFFVLQLWKIDIKPDGESDSMKAAAEKVRLPRKSELSEKMRDASDEELQALSELAQWMASNEVLLMTGRRHGIQIGLTREVAEFVSLSFHSDKGKQLAANVLILPEVIILDPTKVSPFPAQA